MRIVLKTVSRKQLKEKGSYKAENTWISHGSLINTNTENVFVRAGVVIREIREDRLVALIIRSSSVHVFDVGTCLDITAQGLIQDCHDKVRKITR